jgi:hypothetical protein
MKELFVPYELALQLKEIGFDEHCLANYFVFGNARAIEDDKFTKPELFLPDDDVENRAEELNMIPYHDVSIPLYDQVIQWFIDKHGIHIHVDFAIGWGYQLLMIGSAFSFSEEFIDNIGCENRHQALNAGISKAIQLIKEKGVIT